MRIVHVSVRDFYLTIERARLGLGEEAALALHFPDEPGFVVACSESAAARGVRRRMPLDKARAALPDGVFVPADYQSYARISDQLNSSLRERYPFTEQLDFYEWFSDLTEEPDGWSEDLLRENFRRPYPFRVDIHASRNKFLAKLGNETGRTISDPHIRDVLSGLDLKHFWGIPRKWIQEFKKMGLEKIGEVGGLDAELLEKKFPGQGRRMAALGRGEDDHEVLPFAKPTRLSRNGMFRMAEGSESHKKILTRLTGELSDQLQKNGHAGFALTLEMTGGGQRVTHRYRFLLPTSRPSSLLVGALSMLKKMRDLLPEAAPLELNLSVCEIVCDRERYQLHGSPRSDLEILRGF
ncbi:hypothetical protein HY522_10100 [bacterium]|nr:hypothetical protein [bacterium]